MTIDDNSILNLRIEILTEKKLVGQRITMTFAENKTQQLWKNFMPRRNEVQHKVSADLISMQIYDPSFEFQQLDPNKLFDKWAVIEVYDFDHVPAGMETYTLSSGLYAVFLHQGPASEGERTFRYIFETWIPRSPYVLDSRPHFEILGERYKHEDPASEEEVWISIKLKHLTELPI